MSDPKTPNLELFDIIFASKDYVNQLEKIYLEDYNIPRTLGQIITSYLSHLKKTFDPNELDLLNPRNFYLPNLTENEANNEYDSNDSIQVAAILLPPNFTQNYKDQNAHIKNIEKNFPHNIESIYYTSKSPFLINNFDYQEFEPWFMIGKIKDTQNSLCQYNYFAWTSSIDDSYLNPHSTKCLIPKINTKFYISAKLEDIYFGALRPSQREEFDKFHNLDETFRDFGFVGTKIQNYLLPKIRNMLKSIPIGSIQKKTKCNFELNKQRKKIKR